MKKGLSQTYTVNFEFEVIADSEPKAIEQAKNYLKIGGLNAIDKVLVQPGSMHAEDQMAHALIVQGLRSLCQYSGNVKSLLAYQTWLEDFVSEFSDEIADGDSTLYQIPDGIASNKVLWETPDGLFEFFPSAAIEALLKVSRQHGQLDHYGINRWLKSHGKTINHSLMLIYDFA